ncbi:MAG TPA: ATP phosphoribosyltransferase regulatory subunit, partial [Gammaproteobacteria bacterium]|nr:ATP phosphoribosyltransferase regulatory subunit [Gammaproteobacteria bacterium]
MNRWLLPQGIEDVLPERAEAIEGLRRRVLDLYHRWGYELIMPPEVEFLDSLLTGVGGDLSLRTMKVVDQPSGHLMGFRADMTPQVARVDANRLEGDGPRRLCYAGTVLRAQPDIYGRSRAPLQVGAEVFGVSGPSADGEVIGLMAATLSEVGIREFTLDLGHVGLYRALVEDLDADADREARIRDAVRRKDREAVTAALEGTGASSDLCGALEALTALHGGPEVLEKA